MHWHLRIVQLGGLLNSHLSTLFSLWVVVLAAVPGRIYEYGSQNYNMGYVLHVQPVDDVSFRF